MWRELGVPALFYVSLAPKLSRLQSRIGLATVLRIIEGRVPNKEGDFEDKRVNSANYGINIMGCEAVIDESAQPSILYEVNQKKSFTPYLLVHRTHSKNVPSHYCSLSKVLGKMLKKSITK